MYQQEEVSPLIKEEYEDYLRFIDEALETAEKIPKYFSKFSNKIYCNHQKFAIYVLMQKLKLTTRGVVSWPRSNSDARLILGLYRVPVHTTIIRFVNKIKKFINLVLNIRQADTTAIDATGFELETKSFYYRNINKHLFPEYQRKIKKYMKLNIVIDTDKQLILKCKINKKAGRDNYNYVRDLIKDLKIKYLIADKGYDSKRTRSFVIRKLKAIPVIPLHLHNNFYGYMHTKKISGSNYHQRSKVETVFSVIKRKYGSVLRNRSYATQQVELISKLIAYNLDRKLNYLIMLIRGLHQSRI